MLVITDRHGSNAASWKATPSRCSMRSSCGLRPPTRTEPEVGTSRSATMRSSVDLPQPDEPSRAVNDPASVFMLMSWRASKVVRRILNTLSTCSTAMSTPCGLALGGSSTVLVTSPAS